VGYDKSDYVTERAFATARDGKRVPVSIVYKKGTQKDGSHPLAINWLWFLWLNFLCYFQQ
jgi:protease II